MDAMTSVEFRRAPRRNPRRDAPIANDATYTLIRQLVEYRYAQGMTQRDVALKMGVSEQRVGGIEQCYSDFSVGTLLKYAESVGVEITLRLNDE
jgi:DNA-binding XRE family transcriptional regulator